MNNQETQKGIAIGLFTGALVGSVFGLLYAPKSGEELRKDVKLRKDDFLNDAEEYINQTRNKTKTFIENSKNSSKNAVAAAKNKIEILLDDAENILNDVSNKSNEILNSNRHLIERENRRIREAVKAGIDTFNDQRKV